MRGRTDLQKLGAYHTGSSPSANRSAGAAGVSVSSAAARWPCPGDSKRNRRNGGAKNGTNRQIMGERSQNATRLGSTADHDVTVLVEPGTDGSSGGRIIARACACLVTRTAGGECFTRKRNHRTRLFATRRSLSNVCTRQIPSCPCVRRRYCASHVNK